jgi:virulence factor Mce-like protein
MARVSYTERSDAYFVRHGLVLLVVALLVVGIVNLKLRGAFAETAHVTAQMTDIGGGVVPGSDVKMRGVIVGRVTDVRGRPGRIVLDLEFDNDTIEQIPSDVSARILPASVFGTSFLDLTRSAPGSEATSIADGATIRQDRSAPTLELQRALDSIDQLVKALGPADLAVVLRAMASSLEGRGDEIGQMIEKLDHLLSVINPRIPLLREDMRLLADNMSTVRAIAPALLDALEDTAVVAHGLVQRKEQLASFLAAAIDLVDDGDRLLDATEQQYVRAILTTAGVTDAVFDNREGVSGQIRGLDKLLSRVLTVTDGGPLRIDVRLVDAWQYRYYTPADCPRYEAAAGTNCGRN